jgi:hypothetical protein
VRSYRVATVVGQDERITGITEASSYEQEDTSCTRCDGELLLGRQEGLP